MLVNITTDVFDILSRLKAIDSNYFIVFNTNKHRYEVHNSGQKQTFCLTVPFNKIDARLVPYVRKTRRENADMLIKEMEIHNEKLEQEIKRVQNDEASWKLKEMFDYANKKNNDVNFNDAYKDKWV